MELTVTEKFLKLLVLKDFFMKMAFHRGSCTIFVSIIAELQPVFKIRRDDVIQCLTNEKNVIYHILVTKF